MLVFTCDSQTIYAAPPVQTVQRSPQTVQFQRNFADKSQINFVLRAQTGANGRETGEVDEGG